MSLGKLSLTKIERSREGEPRRRHQEIAVITGQRIGDGEK